MAAPGRDAAEGDGSRSTPRATGWRVPSFATTASSLPSAWIDRVPDPPAATVTEPPPVGHGQTAAFGQADVMIRRRRPWPFGRTRREPHFPDLANAPDIDLVALGVDDDQAWTDLALAALEEPETVDADASMASIDAFDAFPPPGDGPWSLLADDLPETVPHYFAEPAPGGTESTALELETEFWA